MKICFVASECAPFVKTGGLADVVGSLPREIARAGEDVRVILPLITTNCAVLGVVLLNMQEDYNFIESVVHGVTGGIGFLLAIVLFATVREKVEFSEYPESFEGFPICLVSAALLALAFMGFSGMSIF